MPGEAEENFCLSKTEENFSRQLWVAGVRVFSRPRRQKFPPVLKSKWDMLCILFAILGGLVYQDNQNAHFLWACDPLGAAENQRPPR